MSETFPSIWAWLNDFSSRQLIVIGSAALTPRKIIVSLFAIWFFNFLSHLVERAIRRAMSGKGFETGANSSVERFARYGVLSIGTFITLSYIGVNMRTLETFSAVLGVGIGFGLQNITQNFVSGLILLVERPIKRGDIVDVNGTTGRVLDIRARSTMVLTRDDVVIIVPNSEFVTKSVINQSFSGDKIRYTIKVVADSDTDAEKLRKLLLKIAEDHPKVLKSPPPAIGFRESDENGMVFCLFIWLSELWFKDVILSDLRFEIDKHLKANGIMKPVNSMDVFVKSLPRDR
jgi:small-conductance mechanosensitive channel